MAVTDEAIEKLKAMIVSGELRPRQQLIEHARSAGTGTSQASGTA